MVIKEVYNFFRNFESEKGWQNLRACRLFFQPQIIEIDKRLLLDMNKLIFINLQVST